MGIYDRDYYRPTQPPPVYSSLRPRSVVTALIVVNAAVWLADGLFFDGALRVYMAAYVSPPDAPRPYTDTLSHPWLWWQLLTSGFAHAVEFQHILFNMLALFFFGREVEYRYGSKEFLRLFLVTTVFASLVWALIAKFGGGDGGWLVGASGAISGVIILFALNFPHATVLLFFVIPMPAWVAGILFVMLDMFGAFGISGDSNVAFSAHLAGAAFAFVYFQQGWNLSRLSDGIRGRLGSAFRKKPRLRVHDPERDAGPDMAAEVDRILEKISREGEASLTAKERRTLESASREYQRRGKGGGG